MARWRRRPVLSAALRTAVVLVPILASLAVAIILSRVLPRADDVPSTLLWIAVIIAGAASCLLLLERVASRFLPLAALLNISLLFPDHAPARFAVARRSGRWRELQQRLRDAQTRGDLDSAQQLQAVVELVLALSVHDRATRGHSERVRVYTNLLADELKLSPDARARLQWAAMLHDIGKLHVPAATLNKREPLTADEWQAIHRHPDIGAALVAPLLPWLDVWGLAVEQHHERFDGAGYPRGLRTHQVSLAARIVSVADCYEVMTAPRAYKRPMSVAAARAQLIRGAGTQFDPRIVRAFLNISLGRLWRTLGVGALLAQLPLVGGLAGSFRSWSPPAVAAVAAVALLGLTGPASRPAPTVPPGAVAGVRTTHPAPSANPPSTPTPSTSAPAPATAAPVAPPTRPAPVDDTHYPYHFLMRPLATAPPAQAPSARPTGQPIPVRALPR